VLAFAVEMNEPQRVCSRCGGSYSDDVIFCPKDGTPLGARKTEVVDDPYLELRVAGQFHLKQLIGIGAMGRVYRAHQTGIERDVAMKILHRDLLRNPTVIARFHREAKVASRLVHPNVVQVLMTGELERSGQDVGGEAYLVMEFLDGISLRSALAAAGSAMPLPRALHVILQVCDAVGEAHAQGIVHRDLKPENVMLVRRGDDTDFVKVLDFGVARMDWIDNSVATQAGVIFGTARYISPEGARGTQVAAAGDVYSIATMLFQCLSAETPFDGDNPVAILLKHTSEAPPDVRSRPRASYVPEPIARVITANLAKEPSERCRDAREFGRALIEAARMSGLHPDDLVLRSTLFSGARGALQLASMERTKALNFSPETRAKMAGGTTPGASQTEIANDGSTDGMLEGTGNGRNRAGGTQLISTPRERLASSPIARTAADTEPLRPALTSHNGDRVSLVEPTLADEPAGDLLSARAGVGPHEASHRREIGDLDRTSLPSRPSFPSSFPTGDEGSPQRRLLLVLSCFVVGVALTLLVAHRLGAFAKPEPSLETYAERARAAASARAFDDPPGENVKDITDAALRRWPGAAAIVEIRRDVARELVERAHQLKSGEPRRALRLMELALELDPESEKARDLQAELAAAPERRALTESSSLVEENRVKPIRKPAEGQSRETTRPKSKKGPTGAKPASSPATKPAPAEPALPVPPAPAGGRWL